jgi:hypothetical protein
VTCIKVGFLRKSVSSRLDGGLESEEEPKEPILIKLLPEERRELEARARKYTSPYRDVVRAKIVLAGGARLIQRSHRCTLGPAAPDCASGENASTRMASRASVSSHELGLPPAFPPNLVVQVKALACELPHCLGLPFCLKSNYVKGPGVWKLLGKLPIHITIFGRLLSPGRVFDLALVPYLLRSSLSSACRVMAALF